MKMNGLNHRNGIINHAGGVVIAGSTAVHRWAVEDGGCDKETSGRNGGEVTIRIIIIVALIGVLLSGCMPEVEPDVVTRKGNYISSTSFGYIVERHVDYDAGVVCYTVYKAGIDCIPMENTRLR